MIEQSITDRALNWTHPFIVLLAAGLILLLTACNRQPSTEASTPTRSGQTASSGGNAVSAPTEAGLGMPIYPGAKPADGQDSQLQTVANGAGERSAFALLQTGDSVRAVADFYRQRMTAPGPDGKPTPPQERADTRDGRPVITLCRIDGANGMKTAEIRQGDRVTLIELMNLAVTGPFRQAPGRDQAPGRPNAAAVGSLNKILSQSGGVHPKDQAPAR